MFRGPPGLFREQEHCSWVGRSFEAIFLPWLSQCFLASQQQVFKVVSQVSGEEHSRQEWEGSEHAISGRASALWLLPRLASGLYIGPLCIWLSNSCLKEPHLSSLGFIWAKANSCTSQAKDQCVGCRCFFKMLLLWSHLRNHYQR